jgi:hypothetical protein
MTVGTVLGTIGLAANAVGSSFEMASTGIQMLDTSASDALVRQKVRSAIDMNIFAAALREEKAMEATVRQKDVLKFVSQDETTGKLYQKHYDSIGAIIDEAMGVKTAAH